MSLPVAWSSTGLINLQLFDVAICAQEINKAVNGSIGIVFPGERAVCKHHRRNGAVNFQSLDCVNNVVNAETVTMNMCFLSCTYYTSWSSPLLLMTMSSLLMALAKVKRRRISRRSRNLHLRSPENLIGPVLYSIYL